MKLETNLGDGKQLSISLDSSDKVTQVVLFDSLGDKSGMLFFIKEDPNYYRFVKGNKNGRWELVSRGKLPKEVLHLLEEPFKEKHEIEV